MADDVDKDTKWYTGEVQYDGLPLQLRFPEKPDFDTLEKRYPKLLKVTHRLVKVTTSGMPESAYNKTLAQFDHEMIVAFEPSSGITVLVETFGGNRIYYIYVAATAKVKEMKERFLKKYPEHHLEWELKDDPHWKFIRRYSEDYKFY